mgnify:FL=1
MKQDKTILSLIKIGKSEYQQALFEKGQIYMQTAQYFKTLEDDEGRGDKLEGAINVEQLTWIKMLSGDQEILIEKSNGSMIRGNVVTDDLNFNCNIYSMIGLTEDDINIEAPIDLSNSSLGDYFILIYNVREFNKRIKEKLEEMKLKNSWDMVTYYDEYQHEGKLDIFMKSAKFKSQKEIRYVAFRDENEPLIFEIGNISDIAIKCSIDKLRSIKLINENEIQIMN